MGLEGLSNAALAAALSFISFSSNHLFHFMRLLITKQCIDKVFLFYNKEPIYSPNIYLIFKTSILFPEKA